jgi:alkanesulfonate monooxygenase SsuD/methylene tetrahydromethanopterin reductase-like flavin-dependent oxidoreductase (luciferase family)
MLELTRRRADGWIPSLFLLQPESAYRALDRVRAAALHAGRQPDALRYACNVGVLVDDRAAPQPGRLTGSAEQVAENLAEFVAHGFTCFLFWFSDETREQMERLAHQVIPSLRPRIEPPVSSP